MSGIIVELGHVGSAAAMDVDGRDATHHDLVGVAIESSEAGPQSHTVVAVVASEGGRVVATLS